MYQAFIENASVFPAPLNSIVFGALTLLIVTIVIEKILKIMQSYSVRKAIRRAINFTKAIGKRLEEALQDPTEKLHLRTWVKRANCQLWIGVSYALSLYMLTFFALFAIIANHPNLTLKSKALSIGMAAVFVLLARYYKCEAGRERVRLSEMA